MRTESEVIKVLGAFVGEEQRIGSELIRTLEKHHTIFRRLKKMGANNASLLLLSRSVNVRHRYHVRVHKPEASLELAQKFDHEIKNVVTSWLGPLSPEQEMIARLPLKKGGLGIPATEPLRNAAYTSSRHAVFEHQKTFSARMAQRMEPPAPAGTLEESHKTPEDEVVTETKRATEIQTNFLKNKEWAPTIKACSKKGSYEWLIGNRKIIPSHIYTLNIMSRLKISHPQLPNSLLCPGCKKLLSSSEALTHIPGCVKCAGHNVTTKHHALVRYLYELCLRAGLPCEREPRQFSYYECSACAATIHPENKTEHTRTCVGSTLRRTGPDLAIQWASGEKYYDLTVVHELAPSNIKHNTTFLMNEAIKRKRVRYVDSGMINKECFECIPVLSCGSMHNATRNLLWAIADRCGLERHSVMETFTLLHQEQAGSILHAQLRQFLAHDQYTETSF